MLLDIRERDLAIHLPMWPLKQLPIGDLWIGLSGEMIAPGGVIAERKAADDLEASILDGRYREQRTRLLSHCQQTGARALYIIEGDLDRLHGRLTKQALLKFLTRLTLRYGVAVLQTANLRETAELARILHDQWKEDPQVFQGQTVAYAEVLSVSRKQNRQDNLASAMLQQCPGVSATVAQALMTQFQSFASLYKATEAEIANVQMDKRRVGPAVAKRLYAALHDGAPENPTAAEMSVAPITDNIVGTSLTNTNPQTKDATTPMKVSKEKRKVDK